MSDLSKYVHLMPADPDGARLEEVQPGQLVVVRWAGKRITFLTIGVKPADEPGEEV